MIVGIDVSSAASSSISGVGYHTINLVQQMDEIADERFRFVLFYCPEDKDDTERLRERFLVSDRVSLQRVWFPKTRFSKIRRLKDRVVWRHVVQRASCDLFHGIAHLVPGGVGCKKIVTIHDLAFFDFDLYDEAFNSALRGRVEHSVQNADSVICLSENTRRDLERLLHRSEDVSVIYGAGNYASAADRLVGPNDAADLRRDFGIANRYVLYVGDFGSRKNLPYLINAFARYQATSPERRLQLVLVGNCKDAKAGLMDCARSAGVASGDIVFTGRISDDQIKLVYRNAHVFVLPSLAEGFTLVTLEAMSFGVPVIATDTSSISEGTGDAAKLVPVDDVDAFSHAIRDVTSETKLRDGMTRKGFERVARFSWESAAQQTLELYQETIGPSADLS
ncbi:MAG: glycosyltransferase family 1 protein [Pseudomonadota bacterium]